jgi:hypothetical protein
MRRKTWSSILDKNNMKLYRFHVGIVVFFHYMWVKHYWGKLLFLYVELGWYTKCGKFLVLGNLKSEFCCNIHIIPLARDG